MRHEITWRKYRQSDIYYRDLDAVVALHLETERTLGVAMTLPDLDKPPVMEAWLAERDGVVIGGAYYEAVCEPVFFGIDPVVSASARRHMPIVAANMARRGLRLARIAVPRWIGKNAEIISLELQAAGFIPADDYHHLYYKIPRAEAA